jgi:hypothetical protein
MLINEISEVTEEDTDYLNKKYWLNKTKFHLSAIKLYVYSK